MKKGEERGRWARVIYSAAGGAAVGRPGADADEFRVCRQGYGGGYYARHRHRRRGMQLIIIQRLGYGQIDSVILARQSISFQFHIDHPGLRNPILQRAYAGVNIGREERER